MKKEIITVSDQYYILSTSPRIDDRTRALKHGDAFAVFNWFGDIDDVYGSGEQGIYYQDTRFISRFTLKLEGSRPLLLSSTIKDDNASLAVDSMNPDIRRNGEMTVPRGTVHIFQSKFLWEERLYESIQILNYGENPVRLDLSLSFEADFADLFEIRGTSRKQRGHHATPIVEANKVKHIYEGLDRRTRYTSIYFDPVPDKLSEKEAHYDIKLPVGRKKEFQCSISCEIEPKPRNKKYTYLIQYSYERARKKAAKALYRARSKNPDIQTSNEQLNDWINRSIADLQMMLTDTEYGTYPYAGIPWFNTVFGRDGIITAMECLSFCPDIARGVLSYLAATQSTYHNAEQDAEPGKIVHETRAGEMATLGEVPFQRYYGSIDATPLFIILAGAYYERSGDLKFIEKLWTNIELALNWIDNYGDLDGDGFVEYSRHSSIGLINQGWKDSFDSVFYEDGSLARGPIALCEVQGYVYAAKMAASKLATALGKTEQAKMLAEKSSHLQQRFESQFWCEDLSIYVMALDGEKNICRVKSSNAGHCLFTGIASERHARRLVKTMMSENFYSGWGIRTIPFGEARYNPMSYHNGSVWPHDNALIAAGLARYGFKEEAARIFTGLFDASIFFDLHRLPEVFCGFSRRIGETPTLYPIACNPQTWASAAVFLLLESCLGLKVFGSEKKVIFSNPTLPESIQQLTIRKLIVGKAELDLLITRHIEGDVGINVLQKKGQVELIIVK